MVIDCGLGEFDGCNCSCHRTGAVHVVPCCGKTRELGPGRELDLQVAQALGQVPCTAWHTAAHPLMGLMVDGDHVQAHNCYPVQIGPPAYSTNIQAAWSLVERFRFHVRPLMGLRTGWSVGYPEDALVTADTVAHAICLATLQAV